MRICTVCKEAFKPSSRHLKCPACRAKEQRIPCPLCGVLMRPESKQCYRCRDIEEENNPNWKGGRTTSSKGYILIKAKGHPRAVKNSGYVFEHILIMEEHLGRYLYDDENVHHKYGVKDDNNIDNLELWVVNQPAGQRVEDLADWAEIILARYRPEKLV